VKQTAAILFAFLSGCCHCPQGKTELLPFVRSGVEDVLREQRADQWRHEMGLAVQRLAARTLEDFWMALGDARAEGVAQVGFPREEVLAGRKKLVDKMKLHARNLAHALTFGYRARIWSDAAVLVSNEQGLLRRTERDLDLAIDGEGFFRVRLPDNTIAFTRGGNLNIDSQGNLVTMEDHLLDPPITVPDNVTRLFIDQTGLVQGFDPQNPTTLQLVGQLEVTRFPNPSGLDAINEVLYRDMPAAGSRIDGQPGQGLGFGRVLQGFLEESNVDMAREAVDLRETLSLYRTLGSVGK
jgi:flagellar basal body rod protein FlgG